MLDDDTKAKIFEHYQKGQGSIQDIARVYRCSVDEVLQIIGQSEMLQVAFTGDMIDQSEAGHIPVNTQGSIHPVSFDNS